jgi:phosphoglycerate dehydrogenase-like enzyme
MAFDANRTDLCVGVIGTGAMGRGIVQVSAAGGMHVHRGGPVGGPRISSVLRLSGNAKE